MLQFELRGVEVKLHGTRQDSPPKMAAIEYELIVDTGESDHRLELLHKNVRKYGTVSNTVAAGTALTGRIRRHLPSDHEEVPFNQARASDTPPEYETWHTGP